MYLLLSPTLMWIYSSFPVPEHIPTVFQATHHSIGATYGIVFKLKRRCTFQVWDHSIIWRECNTYLSSAQCNQTPFTRIALIGLMRLAAHLNMYNADVILSCTNLFNPGWEVELGSCEGALQHRKIFSRKIDPIINGICNMDSFDPFEKLKTEKPTVTILSYVQYVKDVKNALLAADIIVNEWGFKDYRLDVYGGLDRTPAYTVECQEIIASKSLQGYVTLKGYGNPKRVLEDTWVFINSSISEGLPLAIGEAALTGAPIVCTDVGATFQVLTDPDDPKKRYGSVIAPNDPRALARAQISLLAVMDEWVQYGEDDTLRSQVPNISLLRTLKESPSECTRKLHSAVNWVYNYVKSCKNPSQETDISANTNKCSGLGSIKLKREDLKQWHDIMRRLLNSWMMKMSKPNPVLALFAMFPDSVRSILPWKQAKEQIVRDRDLLVGMMKRNHRQGQLWRDLLKRVMGINIRET